MFSPHSSLVGPEKFYGCYIAFEKMDGTFSFLIYDKRYKPEGIPLFVAVISSESAGRLSEFIQSAHEGMAIFYGGMTEEDMMAYKETGEKPLGSSLPPEVPD